MTEGILDKAKSLSDSLKDKVTGLNEFMIENDKNEIISLFKEKGVSKIDEIFETIDRYRSVFTDAGYQIGGINTSLGIPPDITIVFKFLGTIDTEKRKLVLEEAEENKLVIIILESLFKASDFSEKIKVEELTLKTINVKLGLIPAISIALG
ncbi:MAG: hypothetical protein OZ915_03490 [Ignavibacteriales bacterium]|jgi:hypothetical protein|nr:MAG: hypothetical protein F9K42_13275 [Ignavibacterium sp.]MDX9711336.1 hypothetical protein [Ignavibacteriaceae bacterium]MEB2354214.1 hypothetical protein [Ignavibacteriales bacterium]GIK20694.1 MAG: hypothetical protein BroJett005_01080 [Ignavibacteriota bacterium]